LWKFLIVSFVIECTMFAAVIHSGVSHCASVLMCSRWQQIMLAAVRLRLSSIGCKLRTLRPPRPIYTSLRSFTSSSAADRHPATMHTKAVIFDMGGVLVPSPVPFLAGTHTLLSI